jgi:hypothetical protein
MDYFAGLDVSLEAVNVCIVDGDGSVLLEQKVGAEPQEIVALLKEFGRPLKRRWSGSWSDVVLVIHRVASSRLSSALS